ncbi:hypothetical protein [Lacipirellula limnantheis]|uniref:DUF1772 domain-containing protein n=1 Tax=Lacipirellula limnantheis TaxID=2528024 RepID=A0A517TWF4_9BACT|nr:hypothetical protein [Lacipirellula limnantheis]QDT72703.1 hypothetical protein I41_18850 [Lacipirellula limnantheis]
MHDTLTRAIFLAQLGSTLFMTGLIWFVQVVHYPLFAAAGAGEYADYQRRHMSRTTWVVGPPMLIEAATALLLFAFRPAHVATWQLAIALALLALIWLSTIFFQVRCHDALCRGFDPAAHRRLVATNWIRTAAWSLRSALVLLMAW